MEPCVPLWAAATRGRRSRGHRRNHLDSLKIARVVREVSGASKADPFLVAALVYRQSRCRPGLTGPSGIGLLQIQPVMFAAGAPLPFPREDLARDRLLDPAHNLRTGVALLRM